MTNQKKADSALSNTLSTLEELPNGETLVREQAILIEGTSSGQVTQGTVQIQTFTQKEKLIRALRYGGLCWGLGLVSLFIPLLHFVLVPAFLLAGPILAYSIYGVNQVTLGGKGACPECALEFQIVQSRYRFPIAELCEHCKRSVTVRISEAL